MEAIYQEEKSKILFFLGILFLKAVGSILTLFLLQVLISAVMESNPNFDYLYLLALLTGLAFLFTRCATVNSYYFIDIFYQVQRQVLTMMIYEKVSKVSEYVLKSKEVSKIYNLINSDFNITESLMYNSSFLIGAPL